MGSQPQRGHGIDVLQWPAVGAFLRWRHARTALQLVLLAGAALVVLDGVAVSSVDPTTFTTVAVWTHYRGLLIVALLAAGNLFCAGCPFVLARDAGRTLHAPTRTFPRWLRTKWIAIVLFAAILFCYEFFGLWALPRATAYVVLLYFAGALAVDLVFTGANFCKYVCPIGQFNFVTSMVSPFELRVRETDTCRTCRTVDCIKGNDLQRGCELRLFLPAKVGNMDCTLCLDCVHACPHDNIAMAARVPGAELADPARRSGIGRFARRPDIAALIVLFVFGSLMNAFGMIAPVRGLEDAVARSLDLSGRAPAFAVLFAVGIVVVPSVLLAIVALATRVSARDHTRRLAEIAISFAYGLVPLGVGMWAAHYLFHLLIGAFSIVPVTQRAAQDLLGRAALGAPLWQLRGMRPGSVFPIQAGLILLGMLGALAAVFEISERDYPRRTMAAMIPWALLVVVLAGAALWIVAQPMDMRGLVALG